MQSSDETHHGEKEEFNISKDMDDFSKKLARLTKKIQKDEKKVGSFHARFKSASPTDRSKKSKNISPRGGNLAMPIDFYKIGL